MDWNVLIYLMPLITAVIGWFTNFVAIKMLFHPRKPIKLFFFTLHGVFPKRQHIIGEKLGQLIANELLSVEDVSQQVLTEANVGRMQERIENRLHEYLFDTFPDRHPIAALFVGEKRRIAFADEILVEIKEKTPALIQEYIEQMEDEVDIADIVRKKVNALDAKRLEQLMMDVLKQEFRFIELVGLFIGLLVGLFQFFVWMFLQ